MTQVYEPLHAIARDIEQHLRLTDDRARVVSQVQYERHRWQLCVMVGDTSRVWSLDLERCSWDVELAERTVREMREWVEGVDSLGWDANGAPCTEVA